MAMTINTNVQSLNAQRNLTTSQNSLSTSMQRLSSGLRVNSAKDDAAGLAIAMRKEGAIREANAKIRIANDEISAAQTSEGKLATVGEGLQRMRELAVQHTNNSYSPADKANLATEFAALKTEITGMSPSYTVPAGLAITDAGTVFDTELDLVSTARAGFGATMSQLQMRIQNLQISSENESAARGRIMDADFAVETANLSRAQILQQAGTAMVAQANQLPQTVLQLLKG
jgi:flagellin